MLAGLVVILDLMMAFRDGLFEGVGLLNLGHWALHLLDRRIIEEQLNTRAVAEFGLPIPCCQSSVHYYTPIKFYFNHICTQSSVFKTSKFFEPLYQLGIK